jgi:hypothetical protein
MLQRLRRAFVDNVVLPRLIRTGWRRAAWTPLSDYYLQPSFGFDEEEDIKQAVRTVRDNAWQTLERLATLWLQVRYLDRCHIPGSFVECGTYKGGSVGMMALAHRKTSPTPARRLHLFDSFQGLPEPKAEIDGHAAVAFTNGRASGSLVTTDKCVGPLEENKRLLEQVIGYPPDLLTYHVGWFQDTLPREAPGLGEIALLRLDGDWYDSTRLPLEHLYDKVVKGGVVVIDDYGDFKGCRRAVDEFIGRRGEPILLNHIDAAARFWVKI